ncbi:MAG: hypothetical protein HY078_01310 [Elusimicrobia bacterium]|nr:hypothetical protein [Elusimicrobiota bacterium]
MNRAISRLAAAAAVLFLTGADMQGAKEASKTSSLVFALKGTVKAGRYSVRYDLNADGRPILTTDIDRKCGILVFDAGRSGASGRNGRELLGSRADLDGQGKPDGYENGFHALWAMVRKAIDEGVIPATAAERQILAPEDLDRLEAAYGLKMKVGSLLSKPVSLKEAGVGAILLSKRKPSPVMRFDDNGDGVSRQTGAMFIRADGSQGSYEDVWFRAR